MKFERTFDLRNPMAHEGPRFCVHVIDGPGEETPGRLRTLRFDYNADASEWLMVQWVTNGGRRTGIKSVNLTGEHIDRGSFFVLEAFDQDPDEAVRTEGKRHFEEWARRAGNREKVEAFPEEWLPKRVLEARKAGKDKDKKWRVPKREKATSARA